MWPRGVETKGKMTLERQVKVNNGSSMNRLKVVAFFMCVYNVGGRLELYCSD